ncbi:MAG: rRNA maturation RNase YbeY [Alphaproteobacteria bacterium]
MLTVDIMLDDQAWTRAVPDLEKIVHQTLIAAAGGRAKGSVSVLLTNDARQRALNRQFRKQDKTTNVLSFPSGMASPPFEEADSLLGDLALAFETLAAEAEGANRPLADHLAHLLVHGFLHLLGYDHQTDAETKEMEGLEIAILKTLDIRDPYADDIGEYEVKA